VAKSLSAFNRLASDPPAWVRLIAVAGVALVALGLAVRRGWAVGLLAALVYGAMALLMALAPSSVGSWSRRHPIVDGAMFGPLVLLALAYLTRWPFWLCATVGVIGAVIGGLRGLQRGWRLRDS
jgi:hypothetical protein